MNFLLIITLAIVIEGITEYFKQAIPGLKERTWLILVMTIVLGIVSAVAFNADIFYVLGFESKLPLVGCILTGILCARGSNYIYDLIGKLTEVKTDKGTDSDIEFKNAIGFVTQESEDIDE